MSEHDKGFAKHDGSEKSGETLLYKHTFSVFIMFCKCNALARNIFSLPGIILLLFTKAYDIKDDSWLVYQSYLRLYEIRKFSEQLYV